MYFYHLCPNMLYILSYIIIIYAPTNCRFYHVLLSYMPSRHAPKVDRFPSTVETPATNGEVREEEGVEAEPVKNGGTEETPETEEAPQIAPVSFEDAVPAAPEPEVTPEVTPDQTAVNGHSQVDPDQTLEQYQSTEVPAEAPESSPQVPAAVENAPLISEASEVTPPAEVPLEHSANGISNGAGGNGWEVCSFSFLFCLVLARSL